MASIAIVKAVQHLVVLSKNGLGNVQILHVVNLVPFLVADGQSLQVNGVDEGNDTQHLFVVFVVAHSEAVGIKEGYILVLRELARELIDVYRLVVLVDLLIIKGLLRHEVHDVAVLVDGYHRAVHPAFIFRYEGKVGIRIVYNHRNQTIVENQVALNEQRIVFLKLVFYQSQRIDVVGLVVDRIL